MRESGISNVGQVSWGAHLCQFYRGWQDLADIVVPYLKAGLEGNECCIWVTGDLLPVAKAEQALRAAVPDFDRRRQLGQVEVLDSREWYLAGGAFDAGRVFEAGRLKLEIALACGYAGLRMAGDMSWVGAEDWDQVIEYEEAANRMMGQAPVLALCCYPLAKTPASGSPKLTRAHSFALAPAGDGWDVV